MKPNFDWEWTERERKASFAFLFGTNEKGGLEGYLRMLALIAAHLNDDHGISLAHAAKLISKREG